MQRTGKRSKAVVRGSFRLVPLLLALLLLPPVEAKAQYSCLVETPGAPACGASPDPGSHPRTNAAPRYVGNPIDVVGGNKYRREDDFRALGSSLAFSRHYNSALVDHDLGLGPGWRHSYQVYLTRIDAGTLRIVQSDGRRVVFSASADAARHLSPGGRDGHVEALADRHVWHRPDGWRVTFQGSWPVRFEFAGVVDETLTLRYERGRLSSVTDAFGRALRLRYTPGRRGLPGYDEASGITVPGHLEALELPGGLEVTYRYDNRANPVSVRYPNDRLVTLGYRDREWRSHLTHRSDVDEEREWRYDEAGRAIAYRNRSTGEAVDVERTLLPDGSVGEALVSRGAGTTSAYRWRADGTEDGRLAVDDVRAMEIVERRCERCEDVHVRSRHGATLSDAEPVEPRDGARDLENPVRPLADDPYTIVHVDSSGRTVIVSTDFRGRVLDVRRDGVSLQDLSAGILRGEDLDALCGGAARCLLELGELQDIANEVEREAVPFLPRSKPGAPGGVTGRFCTLPSGRTCAELERDHELALLSRCSYTASSQGCAPGWEPVSAGQLGIDPSLLSHEDYEAHVTWNRQTKEYVVAFRGSDDGGDVLEDLAQFNGEATSQYQRAQRLARALRAARPGTKITYTGHSLGGGLATTAALTVREEAVIFNAAALHERTADTLGIDRARADVLVSNLVVDGEIITTLQDRTFLEPGYQRPEHDIHLDPPRWISNPAPGRRFVLPRPPDAWLQAQREQAPLLLKPESFRLHVMVSVLESIDSLRKYACGVP